MDVLNSYSRKFRGAVKCLSALLLLSLALGSVSLTKLQAQTLPTKDKLIQRLAQARKLLARFENGISPCFSSQCQAEKNLKLEDIQLAFARIPGDRSQTLPSADFAFEAASFYVVYPFEPVELKFPSTFSYSEWSLWWKRRYTYEQNYRMAWQKFNQEALTAYASLSQYLTEARRLSASPQTRELFDEAWSRGLGRVSYMLRESSRLMDRAARARALGNFSGQREMEEAAIRISREREALEAAMGNQHRGLMKTFFPKMEYTTSVAMLAFIAMTEHLYGTRSPLDPQFLAQVRLSRDSFRELNTALQEFNDLELGVVGMKNFTSNVNPAVASEFEANIQSFLDRVDDQARSITNIVGFYLLFGAAERAGQHILIKVGLPTTANILQIQYDYDFTSELWEKSSRSRVLGQQLPRLRSEMEKRWRDLVDSRQQMLKEIELLEQQIAMIEAQE